MTNEAKSWLPGSGPVIGGVRPLSDTSEGIHQLYKRTYLRAHLDQYARLTRALGGAQDENNTTAEQPLGDRLSVADEDLRRVLIKYKPEWETSMNAPEPTPQEAIDQGRRRVNQGRRRSAMMPFISDADTRAHQEVADLVIAWSNFWADYSVPLDRLSERDQALKFFRAGWESRGVQAMTEEQALREEIREAKAEAWVEGRRDTRYVFNPYRDLTEETT